jgi:hypothetical protein
LNGFDQWFRSVVVDVEQDVDCYGSGEEGGDDRDENVRALVAHVVVVGVVVVVGAARFREFESNSEIQETEDRKWSILSGEAIVATP